jgi:hypothetical protein
MQKVQAVTWSRGRTRSSQEASADTVAYTPRAVFSPTHKRTEGRAPVWGSEFTLKVAHHWGIQQKPLLG